MNIVYSHGPRLKRPQHKMRFVTTRAPDNEYCPIQLGDSPFYWQVSHTHLSQDYVSVKANLGNYNGLTNSREHIQNIQSILDLVTQDNDAGCKVLIVILYGYA
jgi:hypothetical protein